MDTPIGLQNSGGAMTQEQAARIVALALAMHARKREMNDMWSLAERDEARSEERKATCRAYGAAYDELDSYLNMAITATASGPTATIT